MKTLICIIVILSIAFAQTCGGNCPGGKCPNCPCGTTKNMQDISAWCSKYGWNQNCCKCIVSHQSGGNAASMNYNTNDTFDVGLFLPNQSHQLGRMQWRKCPMRTSSQLQLCSLYLWKMGKFFQSMEYTYSMWMLMMIVQDKYVIIFLYIKLLIAFNQSEKCLY